MRRILAQLGALWLCLALSSQPATAAEWTVWNQPGGWNVWSGYGAPYPRPVEGLRLPVPPPFDRAYLPRLTEQTGRLRYIGDMYAQVENCIRRGDASFEASDLAVLERLWDENRIGVSPEDLWQVRYSLMHRAYGGGTAIANASCRLARRWLDQDLPSLRPPSN